jgi:hypothetical protein
MLAILANASGEVVEKDFPLTPVGFGLVGLAVLLGLVYVVTRFDPDR